MGPADTKHLLLVDDDEMIHKTFGLITMLSDYRVSSIYSPDKAFEYAANPSLFDKPDIMVIDYMLGRTPGTDIIKKMRELAYFDNIPIILYTGYDNKTYGTLPQELKVAECLQKPSRSHIILECLNKHSGKVASSQS